MSTAPVIELIEVGKTYETGETLVVALHPVNLQIRKGEFVAIMGPSGSGKTTLMNLLGMLDVPTSGKCLLKNRHIESLVDDELARLRSSCIGFVFQDFHLLDHSSVRENVALPLLYADASENSGRIDVLLKTMGIDSRADHNPNELSGGQQQRVAIARALVNDPDIILADEPTGNLDSTSQDQVMSVLRSLHDTGYTVVVITHEDDVSLHASRIIRMRDGRIVSDDVNTPPPIEKLVFPKPVMTPSKGKWRDGVFRLMTHAREAVRSLLMNKVSSALSMIGIIIGLAVVVSMLALVGSAGREIKKQLEALGKNVVVIRPQGIARLTVSDADMLKEKVKGIEKVALYSDGNGALSVGNKKWQCPLIGTTREFAEIYYTSEPLQGRFISQEDLKSKNNVVVIGRTIANNLFPEGENPVGRQVKLNRMDFTIIGVLPEKGFSLYGDRDNVAYIPLTTFMQRINKTPYLRMLFVQFAEEESLPQAGDNLQNAFKSTYPNLKPDKGSYFIDDSQQVRQAVNESSRTMSNLLLGVSSISLLVAGIGIMNIMLVSVTERTREIGLRKALGATRKELLLQFLIEAIVTSIVGGFFGIIFGIGINYLLSTFAHWEMYLSVWSILLAFGFSAATGVLFGMWPAIEASKLNPIDALRS